MASPGSSSQTRGSWGAQSWWLASASHLPGGASHGGFASGRCHVHMAACDPGTLSSRTCRPRPWSSACSPAQSPVPRHFLGDPKLWGVQESGGDTRRECPPGALGAAGRRQGRGFNSLLCRPGEGPGTGRPAARLGPQPRPCTGQSRVKRGGEAPDPATPSAAWAPPGARDPPQTPGQGEPAPSTRTEACLPHTPHPRALCP